MSKKVFTEKEIQLLSKIPYVKSVSSKGIIYTDEFKRIFIEENEKGKLPRQIFEECGFDIDVIGLHRVHSSGKIRWTPSSIHFSHKALNRFSIDTETLLI